MQGASFFWGKRARTLPTAVSEGIGDIETTWVAGKVQLKPRSLIIRTRASKYACMVGLGLIFSYLLWTVISFVLLFLNVGLPICGLTLRPAKRPRSKSLFGAACMACRLVTLSTWLAPAAVSQKKPWLLLAL